MTDDKILKTIKALLQRTVENGCTEAEASVSAMKAAELLLRYNIDASKLGDAAQEKVVEADTPFWKYNIAAWKWQTRLARAIANITNCRLIIMRPSRGSRYEPATPGRMNFIGKETNCETAKLLAGHLIGETVRFTDLALKRCKKMYGFVEKGYKDAYVDGFIDKLAIRLEEEFVERVEEVSSQVDGGGEQAKTQVTAMVQAMKHEINEYVRSHYRRLGSVNTSSTSTNGAAYGQGFSDGNKATLRNRLSLPSRQQ